MLLVERFGAKTHCLRSVEQEVLDIGMGRKSFENDVIRDSRTKCRAEKAGLKEGDEAIWSLYPW